ncbi:MAG: alpha/beta hydrolase [Burkholderiaceae bacterium]|nr:alpha/beta hydrolase [Burkholderiaceae bacterium]
MNRRTFLEASALATIAPTAMAASDADWFDAARRFRTAKYGKIAYIDRGKGDVVLFLHGFPLNSYQWRGAIERLSSERRCIAADMLAHGQTEAAAGQDVSVAGQASMIADLLDNLGIKTVDIIASDSGGAVAQIFMARHPERVRSALLTNCDTEPDSPPPAVLPVIELAKKGKYAEKWLLSWAKDKDLARSAKGLGGLTFTRPAELSDRTLSTYLDPLVATPERRALIDAYAIALAPNPMAGLEAQLRLSPIPVRIIWGMADNIFGTASADYLDKLFPRSQGVRRIPEAKLFWPEEYPALIAEEARKLWRA